MLLYPHAHLFLSSQQRAMACALSSKPKGLIISKLLSPNLSALLFLFKIEFLGLQKRFAGLKCCQMHMKVNLKRRAAAEGTDWFSLPIIHQLPQFTNSYTYE